MSERERGSTVHDGRVNDEDAFAQTGRTVKEKEVYVSLLLVWVG